MKDTLENRVQINHQRIVRLEDHLDRLVSLIERLLDTQGEIINKVTEPPDEEVDDGMTDVEADSDALASAGHGMDEDYGGTDERL
jgi:hypothetical protein